MSGDHLDKGAWIGAHRTTGTSGTNDWEWVNGDALGYTCWVPGEPNGGTNHLGESQAYGVWGRMLGNWAGFWDDMWMRTDRLGEQAIVESVGYPLEPVQRPRGWEQWSPTNEGSGHWYKIITAARWD